MIGQTEFKAFLAAHDAVAEARLVRVRGSSPRDAGAAIYVAPDAIFGTIGGGQLEFMVIDEARAMLDRGEDAHAMDVPLGPAIGQCCGGRVEIALKRLSEKDKRRAALDAEERARAFPEVYVFGAGHVGRALARCLSLLPVKTVVVDPRKDELALCDAPVERRLTPIPEAEVRSAPPGSAFVVLTHDHSLDFLVTAEALDRGDAVYVGLIGSETKKAGFKSWRRGENPKATVDGLVCPIGAGGGVDKRPEVIAAHVAAEVMAALPSPQAEEFADQYEGGKGSVTEAPKE